MPPQYDVIPEVGGHAPLRNAVNDALDQALPGQDVGLDPKPNIIQQQQKRTLIDDPAAHRDLCEFTPSLLGSVAAPGTVIPVSTDQPGTRIDIEFLRYAGGTRKKSPTRGQVNELAFANADIDCDEVADMLMNVLLHGIAPINAGTDLAERLVPRSPDLRVQIATQRSKVFVEFTMAVARSHTKSHRPFKIVA